MYATIASWATIAPGARCDRILEIVRLSRGDKPRARSNCERVADLLVRRLGHPLAWPAEETFIEITRLFAEYYLRRYLERPLCPGSKAPTGAAAALGVSRAALQRVPQSALWLCSEHTSEGEENVRPDALPEASRWGANIATDATADFCLAGLWNDHLLLFYVRDDY